jgi:hypothetical protein
MGNGTTHMGNSYCRMLSYHHMTHCCKSNMLAHASNYQQSYVAIAIYVLVSEVAFQQADLRMLLIVPSFTHM